MSNKESAYDRYLTTWEGKRVLEQHSLSDTGYWEIRGEDPNCDMGGNHYQPDLGIVEGKLEDVILYAVDLPKFWSWGGGGSIKRLNSIIKVDSNTAKERKELKAKEETLMAELEEVRRKLAGG